MGPSSEPMLTRNSARGNSQPFERYRRVAPFALEFLVTLIKCPNCGRTVLSVASLCPNCAAPLTIERPPHTWQGTLTECRRCGHPVTNEASVCPHCGIRRPGRSIVSPVALAGLAVVLLSTVTLGVVIPRLGPGDKVPTAPPVSVVPPARHRAPASKPDSVTRVAPADSSPRPTAHRDSVPVNAPPVVTLPAPPADTNTHVATATAPPVVAMPAGTQPRWVSDMFVNVRAWPSDSSRIVGVLKPGQMVYAGEPNQEGWQPVYADGVRMGFVARALLKNLPPPGN